MIGFNRKDYPEYYLVLIASSSRWVSSLASWWNATAPVPSSLKLKLGVALLSRPQFSDMRAENDCSTAHSPARQKCCPWGLPVP